MKYAIVGSRNFSDVELFLDRISRHTNITQIISGGAVGADSMAADYAIANNIPLTVYKPDWQRYGAQAGFIRNKLIIDDAEVCVAFWDMKSNGTANSIGHAKRRKIPVIIYNTGTEDNLFTRT